MSIRKLPHWLPAAAFFTPVAIAVLTINVIEGYSWGWFWVVSLVLIAMIANTMLYRELTRRS